MGKAASCSGLMFMAARRRNGAAAIGVKTYIGDADRCTALAPMARNGFHFH